MTGKLIALISTDSFLNPPQQVFQKLLMLKYYTRLAWLSFLIHACMYPKSIKFYYIYSIQITILIGKSENNVRVTDEKSWNINQDELHLPGLAGKVLSSEHILPRHSMSAV